MSNSELSFKDIFVKGAVIYNPVLIQLVGLCPVVAASTTLKSAVMLSAAMCVSLVVTCVLASAVLKNVPRWVRMPVYLLTGLLMICPLLWFVETKTLATLSLGIKIYLPLVLAILKLNSGFGFSDASSITSILSSFFCLDIAMFLVETLALLRATKSFKSAISFCCLLYAASSWAFFMA